MPLDIIVPDRHDKPLQQVSLFIDEYGLSFPFLLQLNNHLYLYRNIHG